MGCILTKVFSKMLLRAPFLFLLLQLGASIDTLTPARGLKYGEVLTSQGGIFSLGFFRPGNSTRRYIGIWYTNVPVQTVVWVANRDIPINDSFGVLSINGDGNLKLSSLEIIVWSTKITVPVSPNDNNSTSCQLHDSGNFVLTSSNGKTVAWQSFDYPTDTQLPSMKLGLDKRTGLYKNLTSWKSIDDPSPGNYSFTVDPNGSPQFFLYQGVVPRWRTGPWVGQSWSGVPELVNRVHTDILSFAFVSNQSEISSVYSVIDDAIPIRMAVNSSSGTVEMCAWFNQQWFQIFSAPKDPCDQYGQCGDYGSCNISVNLPECNCFPGYH